MDLVTLLPAFTVAVLLISASPGPAMALILKHAALRGFRRAVPIVLGLEAGLYVWALLAAAGFAALVAASEVAFVILRVVGAGVLLYLGIRGWIALWRDRHAGAGTGPGDDATPAGGGPTPRGSRRGSWWWAFGEGLLVQLANPKAAVFMVAFYPQFVPPDRPLFATTALLALLQVAIELVIYLSLARMVSRAGTWFRRRPIRRRLEAISSSVLVVLGLRMAISDR